MPPQLQLLIEGLAVRRPPPTIATVHRQAAGAARAQGWPVPGYAAVYDVVHSIDPAMATLAHVWGSNTSPSSLTCNFEAGPMTVILTERVVAFLLSDWAIPAGR
jgi:hypothetical protein